MTWHWINPAAGVKKAAGLLRPEGRLAVFWNVGQPPPGLADAFSEVYQQILPDTPFARAPSDPLAAYERLFTKAANEIQQVGVFSEPKRWQFDWEERYTKDQWLEQVPTFGGHSQFPPATRDELLAGLGARIDAIGKSFTMRYAAVAITTSRLRDPGPNGALSQTVDVPCSHSTHSRATATAG